jgi:membrane protein
MGKQRWLESQSPVLIKPMRFARLWMRWYRYQKLPALAAYLSITFLLSLIPLLTVLLTFSPLMKSFGVEEVGPQQFIGDLLPHNSASIIRELQNFVDNANQIRGWGFLFLFFTVFWLLANIEEQINTLMASPRRRSGIQRFVLFWGVLTTAPLLLGASMLLTSYASTWMAWTGSEQISSFAVSTLLPWLFTVLALYIFYAAIPSRRMNQYNLLFGAVLTAVLLEVAKKGMTWYLSVVPTYQLIFGALAAIPIFILWVYWTWWMVLSGALLIRLMPYYGYEKRYQLTLDELLLLKVWQSYCNSGAINEVHLLTLAPEAPEHLSKLEKDNLVKYTAEGGWLPAKDYQAIPLTSVIASDGMDVSMQLLQEISDSKSGELTLAQWLGHLANTSELAAVK